MRTSLQRFRDLVRGRLINVSYIYIHIYIYIHSNFQQNVGKVA